MKNYLNYPCIEHEVTINFSMGSIMSDEEYDTLLSIMAEGNEVDVLLRNKNKRVVMWKTRIGIQEKPHG